MYIFIGGGLSLNYHSDVKINVLESYFSTKGRYLNKRNHVKKLFLDSGAYSAYTQKITIHLGSYIEYIKKNLDKIDIYANLDEIYNPKKSEENLHLMEKAGLHPLPVYHYGENIEILKKMVEEYDFIALGGMVPVSTNQLIPFLDEAFLQICDKEGRAKVKVHGFGMTTLRLMKRYPWWSVDSISPILTGAMGGVYNEKGQVINVGRKVILNLPETVKFYLGGDIDKETEEALPIDKLKTNPLIGEFTFPEIINNYKARIVINLRYIMKLEKELLENPPVFKQYQKKLL